MKLTVKYFSKQHLIEAYRRGEEWGLNRRLDPGVQGYPDENYVVLYHFRHEREGLNETVPHVRCVVWVPHRLSREESVVLDLKEDDTLKVLLAFRQDWLHLIVDVPLDYFEALPSKEMEWEPAAVPQSSEDDEEDEEDDDEYESP